jgi:glycosyltransferase involved in cell wall biosynthesis
MPAVSIVLPTFNRLRFLRPSLESVLVQTFQDWELLIADDGSDEGTRSYLGELNDPRIKVLWLAHSGNPASVRNAALRAAAGDYIAFQDSDDLWVADKLEIQLAALMSQAERRWNYSGYSCIDQAGRRRPHPGSKPWKAYEGSIFEQILCYQADIVTATVMAQRQLLVSVGGFDERLAMQEDYDLWMRLALASDVGVVERPLVAMRLHDQHYGQGGFEAQLSRHRSLTKLRRMVPDARQLNALEDALAQNALQLALAYAGTDRRAAAAVLHEHWSLIASRRRCWGSLAKLWLKFVIPGWALAWRRARRPH